jgi:hypothetical protein
MLQFELHVAWRFFERGTEEPFFHKLTANVKRPLDVLRSMAWDLAHLRSSLDMLTIESAKPAGAGFPIPYFLSFDQRFIRLLEIFQFRGLIYYGNARRYEVIYGFDFLNSLSEAMHGASEKYLTSDGIADRAKRSRRGDAFVIHLAELAKRTSDELQAHLTLTGSTSASLTS